MKGKVKEISVFKKLLRQEKAKIKRRANNSKTTR